MRPSICPCSERIEQPLWVFLKTMDELVLKSSETGRSRARQAKRLLWRTNRALKNYRQKPFSHDYENSFDWDLLPKPFRRKKLTSDRNQLEEKPKRFRTSSRKQMLRWSRMKPTCNAILLKKRPEKAQKSTVQETYELWVRKFNSRYCPRKVLTKQTIYRILSSWYKPKLCLLRRFYRIKKYRP
jgi:hypothetical protein